MDINHASPEQLLSELNALRSSLAGLETQRPALDASILAPAVKLLQEKITHIEALLDFNSAAPNPVEERPIITILFTDIAASSTIASLLDPEDWFTLIDTVQRLSGDLIKKHGGEVIQYLGDGLLALFGVLEMDEQDAEHAVRAALKIQAGISMLQWPTVIQKAIYAQNSEGKIQMRISIHTDRVAIGRLGSYSRRELTASGEAMNLAGKLQRYAPPGGVLITDKTYHYIRTRFDCLRQPVIKIKEFPTAIQSYLVLRPLLLPALANTRGVSGVNLRTIGRESELENVQGYLQHCLLSRQVTWLQIIGQPGIGKSRLLLDTAGWLKARGDPVLTLRTGAVQGDERQPYSLIRRLWLDAFQITTDMTRAEAESRWMEQYAMLSGAVDEEAAQVLGMMVGLPFLQSPLINAVRQDPIQFKGRAQVIGRQFLSNLLDRSPVILLIEDLQWMDTSSWDFLFQVFLEERERPNGLFILSTTRPEWNPPHGLMRYPGYHQFTLAPLSELHSRQLVSGLLQRVQRLPDTLIGKIVERAEGVPYFAEEIVNWLIDQELICQQEDHWAYTGGKLDIIPIPDTLNQLLSTRLSRLKDIERLALQHGSIFGRKFWEGGLEALGSAGVQSILEQLQKTNLVENEAVSLLEGQKEWRFYHDLLQQAAYDSILKRQRKELHRLAEKWLELQLHKIGRLDEFAGQLALHAEKAGINDVASTWYLSAGKNAFQRCAMVEARAFFDRALELARPTDQEQIWNIISARQDIFARMGEMQAWQADVETLLELARKSAKNLWLAEAFYLYGFYQGVSGNLETELQCYQQGLEAARQAQNPRLECDNLMVKVTCLTRLGRMEEAGAVVTEALSLARSLKIEELLVRVLINASVYYIDAGRLDTAEQLLNEEVEVSRRTRDRWMHCVGLINLGYIYYLLGQYEISRSVLAESLELAKSINMRRESSYARLNLALCYFRLNDLKTTTKILESTADEVEILEDPIGQGVCHSYSGLVQEAYGAHAAALDCFQKAARILKKAGASGYELDAMAGQARCCAALNRAGEALSYANQLWFRLQAGASGLEFPVLAYETCANTLIQFDQHPLALPVIQKGYCELMARAARIEDPVWHASYLRNVVEHGRLVLLWQKICQ